MLKSLFAGVSGLKSHQIAMDVESNNIANVNTTGYKYSRANFSDLLAQTRSIATAPEGSLGGQNAVQVGLGSNVTSMTRIFSQGSVQNTDKNTDVAIQGDGFFIVSPDGGDTYKYTRAGDFKFDANGNFVDPSGYITQGWLRDDETGEVDTSAPITDINIPPGLTTPANATAEVVLKANLNSGANVESFSPAYEVKSTSTGSAIDENGREINSGDLGVMYNELGEAFALQESQGVWASFKSATLGPGVAVAAGAVPLDVSFVIDDGSTVNITAAAGDPANTPLTNANIFMAAINAKTAVTGVAASVSTLGELTLTNTNGTAGASHNINFTDNAGTTGIASGTAITAYQYQYNSTSSVALANSDKTFTTIADLRAALQTQARADGGPLGTNAIEVIVNEQGKLEISNTGTGAEDYSINLRITSISTPDISENERFTTNMLALNTVIPNGTAGKAYSQSFNAATHSSSIDVFDSLGSKHTLRMEFRKTSLDSETGSTWDMKISVPSPATIDTVIPYDEKTGEVKFNSDGSLAAYNPPNVSFTGNNGSSPNQQIDLEFGTANAFDGMTSFDSSSATSGISQDGYTGGDIVGIRIDQSGALIGSFSNGRSFALGQIGMAKFTNNEGLATEGGNVYIQTANSGDPIIGTAATAGRGYIQSSALEASNVDLSSSLTQLIIVQRGYQANGKTITTSDQLLQTLIGLKT